MELNGASSTGYEARMILLQGGYRTLFFIWLTFEVHFLFIEFIDFAVRIVVFL